MFGAPYGTAALGSYLNIKTARAGSQMKPLAPQAGGTVSALVYYVLTQGYVRGAVLTGREGLLPVPQYITDPEAVAQFAQSKYTAAPTLSSLNDAINHGKQPLAVVGTPCQVLAVAQMRRHRKMMGITEDPMGIVIGLFCTWALDFRAFEPFITDRVAPERITKVDIPPPPAEVFQVYVDNRLDLELPLADMRPLIPEGCSYCIDMTSEFADISVGVLEGKPDFNTLVVRTKRGQELVDAAIADGYLAVADMPPENLEHLKWAAANKKRRGVMKANENQLINTTPFAYLRVHSDTLNELTA